MERRKGSREANTREETAVECKGKGEREAKRRGEWVRCNRLEGGNEDTCDDIRIKESQWKAIGK